MPRGIPLSRSRVEWTHSELGTGMVAHGATDAFSRRPLSSSFPPVHGADLEVQQRVDLTRSPSPRRTTGICAMRSLGFLEIAFIQRPTPSHFSSNATHCARDVFQHPSGTPYNFTSSTLM